jgi:3',5'-cyclic-nucleotide phosphodiesterase
MTEPAANRSQGELTQFLLACRNTYNAFVPYHNFRHVVDVLQAVFYFLLQLELLPPYPSTITNSQIPAEAMRPKSPVKTILKPFDVLTLLITAIGHDVGHPGVNNAFLVKLNAPLAQLYNDRSVLESFHCAAFSQVLRRHWPMAFADSDLRKLLINTILATDMGLHFEYMEQLSHLQRRLADHDVADEKFKHDERTLTCALLIKCADISNVVSISSSLSFLFY